MDDIKTTPSGGGEGTRENRELYFRRYRNQKRIYLFRSLYFYSFFIIYKINLKEKNTIYEKKDYSI